MPEATPTKVSVVSDTKHQPDAERQPQLPANELIGESHTEERLTWVVTLLTVALAVVALSSATRWAHERGRLISTMEQGGLLDAHPQLARRVEREAIPHHARLVTARAAVYHVLSQQEALAAGDIEALGLLLSEARELSESALADQPNSWQATMLLGAATYLDFSLHRDRRLYTEAWRWERPLTKAVQDADGRPEPRRILATAYLESWHGLSAEKKALTQDLLRRVFSEDLRAFEALSPSWFALGLPLEQSLAVVPDEPDAWVALERTFAQVHRWPEFIVAHNRKLDALEVVLLRRRAEAEERLRLGEMVRSRELLIGVIQQAPPSRRFLPLVVGALDFYPPGLHGLASTHQLVDWLEWALELDRLGLESLTPTAANRLLDAVGELDPPQAARVALLADDRYQAERFEKLGGPSTLTVWAPYLIAKASWLAEQQKGREAVDSLINVAIGAREDLSFRLAQRQTAAAVGDVVGEGEARRALEQLSASSWDALDWRSFDGTLALGMLPARSATGLEIEITRAGRNGTVVDVTLDGRSLGLYPVVSDQQLLIEAEIDARPHLLGIRALAGGSVAVNTTRLRF